MASKIFVLMNNRNIPVTLVLLCFVMPQRAHADERFAALLAAADEMKPKIESLKIHYRLEDVESTEIIDGSKKDLPLTSEEYAVAGRNVLTQIGQVNSSDIWVQNERYSFQLGVVKDLTPRVIYINQHTPAGSDSIVRDPVVEDMFAFHCCGGFVYGGMPIADFLRLGGFKLQKSEEIERDGKLLVRFEFDYPKELSEGPKVTDAYIICDPSEQWGIVESGMCIKYIDGKVRVRMIGEGTLQVVQGVPITSSRLTISENLDTGRIETTRNKIKILSTSPKPELFTLSHFGLPEPDQVPVDSSWKWYIAAIVAGLGLLWSVRRWRSSHAA